ncbi:hypothetical protein CR513_54026, partial [Mucuna pruriens]
MSKQGSYRDTCSPKGASKPIQIKCQGGPAIGWTNHCIVMIFIVIGQKGAPSIPKPQKERKISMDGHISKVGKGHPSSSDHGQKVETILLKQQDSCPNQPPHQRGHVKAQILADFIAKLTPTEEPTVGVVLEGPDGVLIEQSLQFEFKANNNQAKYEMLVGMRLVEEIGAQVLMAKSDSQLVTGQVNGDY